MRVKVDNNTYELEFAGINGVVTFMTKATIGCPMIGGGQLLYCRIGQRNDLNLFTTWTGEMSEDRMVKSASENEFNKPGFFIGVIDNVLIVRYNNTDVEISDCTLGRVY